MKKNYLISTPIKLTWPKLKKNNLIFASESALMNARGPHNEYSKFYINFSRWVNKNNLNRDYNYLNILYEKLLISLSIKLNSLHSENRSINFWRILIGPWLVNFLSIYCIKWNEIEDAFKKKKIDSAIFLKVNPYVFIPFDHNQFLKFSYNDYWHQYIYQHVTCNFINKKKIIFNNFNTEKLNSILEESKWDYDSSNIYEFIKKILQKFFNLFSMKNNKYFFYNTYFKIKDEIKLNLSHGQLPVLHIDHSKYTQKSINIRLREKMNFSFLNKNKFEKSLNNLLPIQIPRAFLENYSDLKLSYKNSNLPSNPKVIFTSNAGWWDTHMAYYIARSKEKKTKLIYGQHGGNYGIAKILWAEEHEKKISDKFISWGWREKNKKVLPLYMFKKINIKKNKKNDLLIMLKDRQKWYQSFDSCDPTICFRNYVKYYSDFLFNLKKEIVKNTVLRQNPENKNIKSADFYSNLEKKFNFKNDNSISEAFSNSKLVVLTALSTPINQALNSNVPSVLILKKDQNPIRSQANRCFKLLHKNKILFYDSKKAAKFINSIWNDGIEKWWYKKSTQIAVKEFCNNFAKDKKNLVKDLNKILN